MSLNWGVIRLSITSINWQFWTTHYRKQTLDAITDTHTTCHYACLLLVIHPKILLYLHPHMNILQIKHQHGYLGLSRSVSSLIKNHWCVAVSFRGLLCQSETNMHTLCARTDIGCLTQKMLCHQWGFVSRGRLWKSMKASKAQQCWGVDVCCSGDQATIPKPEHTMMD